ncbi:hypothetical protein MesoLj131a_14410 [Mesorhizobium sp. 131-2-1]|nr:hypothetical protein MesoLj131a_14410 [Mesorhizobium sp. 131-2-1]
MGCYRPIAAILGTPAFPGRCEQHLPYEIEVADADVLQRDYDEATPEPISVTGKQEARSFEGDRLIPRRMAFWRVDVASHGSDRWRDVSGRLMGGLGSSKSMEILSFLT